MRCISHALWSAVAATLRSVPLISPVYRADHIVPACYPLRHASVFSHPTDLVHAAAEPAQSSTVLSAAESVGTKRAKAVRGKRQVARAQNPLLRASCPRVFPNEDGSELADATVSTRDVAVLSFFTWHVASRRTGWHCTAPEARCLMARAGQSQDRAPNGASPRGMRGLVLHHALQRVASRHVRASRRTRP